MNANSTSPTLGALASRHPHLWAPVKDRATRLIQHGDPAAVSARMVEANALVGGWSDWSSAKIPPKVVEAKLELLALEQWLRAALAGSSAAAVSPSRRDTLIAQRLFFTRSRERRLVSMRAFRFWWRFVESKGSVMSLLQKMGIYCVYSRELVEGLARLIGKRRCVELGAGDGTLALQLSEAGVQVHAVDDQSWGGQNIRYPGWVEKCDAAAALAKHRPEAAICSWPPPGNAFERRVFATPGLDLYVVIGSKHRFATGDWRAYEEQTAFDLEIYPLMSSQALPPEGDHAVMVFTRKGL